MARSSLIDFSYLNKLALLTFIEEGPSFQIKTQGWVRSQKELKYVLLWNIQDQLVMTSVASINKGHPCSTSFDHRQWNLGLQGVGTGMSPHKVLRQGPVPHKILQQMLHSCVCDCLSNEQAKWPSQL